MSYDLCILVVNQKKPVPIKLKTTIEIIDEFSTEHLGKRYHTIWPFMTKMNGVWYWLVKEHAGVMNAFPICDSDFDTDTSKLPIPPWIVDYNIYKEFTPLIIREGYRNDIENIFRYLIKRSPDKTLMFLSSYQSHCHEIIYGTFSLDEFLKLLDEHKILFNICYIIREDNPQ